METNQPNQSDITLSAQGLSRLYGTNLAVSGVSIELRRGEVVGLLGPNGAGKTTTMQMITGNLAPSLGSINICGVDMIENPTTAKNRIGYLPEVPPLYRELRVDEYLTLASRLRKIKRANIKNAVQTAKQKCGLEDMGKRLISALSKGYRQRVGIAQAIIHEPDVIILDEPTVGLDPNQIREIRSLIRSLGDKHSIILSTHILPEVEAVCDRVHILDHGKVAFSDTIKSMQDNKGECVIEVEFRNPPTNNEIKDKLNKVMVDQKGNNSFRIASHAGDPTDTIVKLAVQNDWGIVKLNPVQASLEEVFVSLTKNGN